ncbi:MAG TPA: hypothetical protein VMV94_10615 [Phycisphaerae bacterium]|nr:hypothetical protein [Phycisphaerae bacterium]
MPVVQTSPPLGLVTVMVGVSARALALETDMAATIMAAEQKRQSYSDLIFFPPLETGVCNMIMPGRATGRCETIIPEIPPLRNSCHERKRERIKAPTRSDHRVGYAQRAGEPIRSLNGGMVV